MRRKVDRSLFQSAVIILSYVSGEPGNLLPLSLSIIMKQWSDMLAATRAHHLFHHNLPKSSWGLTAAVKLHACKIAHPVHVKIHTHIRIRVYEYTAYACNMFACMHMYTRAFHSPPSQTHTQALIRNPNPQHTLLCAGQKEPSKCPGARVMCWVACRPPRPEAPGQPRCYPTHMTALQRPRNVSFVTLDVPEGASYTP